MFPRHWSIKLFPYIVAAGLAACHSVKTDSVKPGATPIKADGQALTSIGQNSEPCFSPDGQKIIFVSAERSRHKHGQVYELDLISRKERRITFQGATAHWPRYNDKGDYILYASATDELKEDPPMLQPKSSDSFSGPSIYREPTELYLHHLRGLDFKRLTKHAGFDGEAKFLTPSKIVFTSRTSKGTEIVEAPLQAGHATPVKGPAARSAQPAPWNGGKRLAWIEYSVDFQTSDLRIKEGKDLTTLLPDIKALKKDLVWRPDGEALVFAMNHPDPLAFEIYEVKRDGECLTQLTNDHVISENPAVSPTGDAFLFVSNQTGTKQIYIKNLKKDLNCTPPQLQAPPPATEPAPPTP